MLKNRAHWVKCAHSHPLESSPNKKSAKFLKVTNCNSFEIDPTTAPDAYALKCDHIWIDSLFEIDCIDRFEMAIIKANSAIILKVSIECVSVFFVFVVVALQINTYPKCAVNELKLKINFVPVFSRTCIHIKIVILFNFLLGIDVRPIVANIFILAASAHRWQ